MLLSWQWAAPGKHQDHVIQRNQRRLRVNADRYLFAENPVVHLDTATAAVNEIPVRQALQCACLSRRKRKV